MIHVPYEVVPVGLTPVLPEGTPRSGGEAIEPMEQRRVAPLGVLDEPTPVVA